MGSMDGSLAKRSFEQTGNAAGMLRRFMNDYGTDAAKRISRIKTGSANCGFPVSSNQVKGGGKDG